MELSAIRTRRSRETTGPTPHAVAIHGKPTLTRAREYLILERRKKEELREQATAMVDYNKQFDLKTKWKLATDKKIQKNTIHRQMENLMQQRQYSLEERRDQLKDLLRNEEEQYLSEIAGKQETTLERQAKMRERARILKEKRETERLGLVEKKLDQRWRDQCEDLRGILSKHHQDEVCKERAEQLRLKKEEKQKRDQEDHLYAQLWEKDYYSRSTREEMECTLQTERNREMVKVLTLQTTAKKQQLEEGKKLIEQEAELLQEETAKRALEDHQMKVEKKQKQERRKAELDYSLKVKLKNQAKEVQEELAMDMKILEQMLTESTNEAMENLQRKHQLQDEMHKYREYLTKQAQEEAEREKELDNLVNSEVQKQWSKRVQQWKMEREARKKLMEDVLDTRKKQIQDRLAKIEEEKTTARTERTDILHNFEQHKQLEFKQQEEIKKANLTYQEHLLKQMDYIKTMKHLEEEQARREIAMCKEAEVVYQQRVEVALARPDPDKVHPKRLLLSGKFV